MVRARPLSIEEQKSAEKSESEFDKCQDEYNSARDEYSKVVFLVSLVVAIVVLFVGYGILNVEPVGSALMGSGVWAIFWGTVINWRNFSDAKVHCRKLHL